MVVKELSSFEKKSLDDYKGTDYVIPDQVLFSSGTWNDYYYSSEVVKSIFEGTDWSSPKIKNLFLDHYDGARDPLTMMMRGGVATWIGQIDNVRFDEPSKSIVGDLHIVDLNTINKIAYPDTKFGVSVKFDPAQFEEVNGRKEVIDASFANTSVVIEPAVKTAYINNSEEGDLFNFFVKSIAKEVINMAEKDKKEDVKEEEQEEQVDEKAEDSKELSQEEMQKLFAAAKRVIDFCKENGLENSEEEKEKAEEKAEEKEEAEEEAEEKEEEKEEAEEKAEEKEEAEEKAEEETKENTETDEILKAIKGLAEKIENSKKTQAQPKDIPGVDIIENEHRINPLNKTDEGMLGFLGDFVKKNK